jgi:hypothetical protein
MEVYHMAPPDVVARFLRRLLEASSMKNVSVAARAQYGWMNMPVASGPTSPPHVVQQRAQGKSREENLIFDKFPAKLSSDGGQLTHRSVD